MSPAGEGQAGEEGRGSPGFEVHPNLGHTETIQKSLEVALPKPWAREEGRVAGPAVARICSIRLRGRCGLYHDSCELGQVYGKNKPHQRCTLLKGLVPVTYMAKSLSEKDMNSWSITESQSLFQVPLWQGSLTGVSKELPPAEGAAHPAMVPKETSSQRGDRGGWGSGVPGRLHLGFPPGKEGFLACPCLYVNTCSCNISLVQGESMPARTVRSTWLLCARERAGTKSTGDKRVWPEHPIKPSRTLLTYSPGAPLPPLLLSQRLPENTDLLHHLQLLPEALHLFLYVVKFVLFHPQHHLGRGEEPEVTQEPPPRKGRRAPAQARW